MPSMRGLSVILTAGDPERLGAALALAAAAAALGGRARLYFHDQAVQLLADADLSPAFDHDVSVIACQTGLAEANLDLSALDPRIEAGGMVSLLAALGDDRLVTL